MICLGTKATKAATSQVSDLFYSSLFNEVLFVRRELPDEKGDTPKFQPITFDNLCHKN